MKTEPHTKEPIVSLYPKEELMGDEELVRQDSEAARSELLVRIERRQKGRFKPLLIIRPHHLERASEATIEMCADLGVGIADDEIERRRLAGEAVAA